MTEKAEGHHPYSARIERSDDHYTAELHAKAGRPGWTSPRPMTAQEIYDELKHRGLHPIDILDAFYACDPDWVRKNPGFKT